jgi:Ca2+-binding RTX toxin-like protein
MRGFPGRASPLIVASAVAASLLGGITSAGTVSSKAPVREEERVRVLKDFARSPLSFEVNRGQTDPQVRYLTRGKGYTLYLTEQEAVFSLSGAHPEPGASGPTSAPPGAALRMALVGTGPNPQVTGRGPLPGVVSYFTGADPREWQTGVPTFARVRYQDVYPGTDLVFRGNRRTLEYDFLLAPGADPNDISMRFRGAEDVRVDADGNLVITTAVGELVHRAPVVYQEVGGERREVPGAYRLHGARVGFAVGAYDQARPLIIDPVVLAYSTFLGGSGPDLGFDIAVDPYTRQAYVTGSASADFPTTTGAFDQTFNENPDVFVTKLEPTGAALSYSTFLGGSGDDQGVGIAVDGAGAAYVTGLTQDETTDFPTTPGAYDETHNGAFDAFVTKLEPTGAALSYSTFLGGSGIDFGFGIAVDGGGAYVTGFTEADDFPTTAGAFDRTHNGLQDAFVTKLGPAGAAPLGYSTFLGGSKDDIGFGVAIDGTGAAYVTGRTVDADTDFPTTSGAFDETHNGLDDAFVTKLEPTGAALSYSTFLGGFGFDHGSDIAIDVTGAAFVAGRTSDADADLPTTSGAFDETHNGDDDAFVTKLEPPGAALSYSTFLGGSDIDAGVGIAVDGVRAAYVIGLTQDDTTDFPTTPGAYDETHNGEADVFVTKLRPTGAAPLGYSTFLGGSSTDRGNAIAVDGTGAAYVTGDTFDDATDFPTTSGAFDETHNQELDAFVTKLVEPTPPGPPLPGPPPGLAPTCRGLTATLAGTDGDDTITGTPGRDVVAALAGNDVVKALGGSDVVCAGQGNDGATGGGGNDTIQGDDGKDRLRGGSGDDKLSGGKGRDTCIGGSGRNLARNCEKEKSIP